MTQAENLSRWQDSGEPHAWVWRCSGAWSDQEFAHLLATLRMGPYWPMNEAEILQTLEDAARTFRDLQRWHLLDGDVQQRTGDPPASTEGEDVWF